MPYKIIYNRPDVDVNYLFKQWQKKETGKFYQEMLEKRRTVEEKTQEA